MTTVSLTLDEVNNLPEKPAAYRLGRGMMNFFVWHAPNIREAALEHLNNERNSCLKRKEPDTLIYEVCHSPNEALMLAREWYRKGGHDCNEIVP